jgi:hypothetical protein
MSVGVAHRCTEPARHLDAPPGFANQTLQLVQLQYPGFANKTLQLVQLQYPGFANKTRQLVQTKRHWRPGSVNWTHLHFFRRDQ